MEDYEAQEIEFWVKLEEEGMSRSTRGGSAQQAAEVLNG